MLYHILNGDSLKERFPEEIKGEVIVARECLVDGPVANTNLLNLISLRSNFFEENYKISSKQYYSDTLSELQKIESIPEGSIVNLWFEDDLFCQVNFWFVINLIYNQNTKCDLFLVRPNKHTQYGFSGLSDTQLTSIYENKLRLDALSELSMLWVHYCNNDLNNLRKTSLKLIDAFPFIHEAVEAHIDRIPTGDNPGRPKKVLMQIMKDLDSKDFGAVFREFNKREFIYGFGDLQVKRLFDELRK